MLYIKVWLIILSLFLMTLDKLSILGRMRDSAAIYIHKQVFLLNYRVQNYPKLVFLQKNQENSLEQENIKLKKEIEQYAILLKQRNNESFDNNLIQSLTAESKLYTKFNMHIAKAIIDINYLIKNQLLINVGRNSGVNIGGAVINKDGLIGQINLANDKNSQVNLITNPSYKIYLQNRTTKSKMLAQGIGNNNLEVKYINKNDKISVGDILTTTGLDDVYPANIAVAKVIKVFDENNGFNAALCTPVVNFNGLSYVVVLTNANH